MIIPDPNNFDDFEEWANNLCLQNPGVPLPTETDWVQWGNSLGLTGSLINFINPNSYDDWQEWAIKLIIINSQDMVKSS
jgi:hypothetical protein